MSSGGRYRPARADWLQAGLVAAALFALYAASSPRTVAMEDDSLFVLSSYFLGVEHPPGYPLFTLIGHLFTYLPFGSVAYRVHLASALFGALTGAALWLCARALALGPLPAWLAALGLGLSPVFWSQAIIAEVYTLNTFFMLVLLLIALRLCPPGNGVPEDAGAARLLPWMALLFGLSLANHYPLMLLVAPAFAVLLWPARYEIVKRLGLLVLLTCLGLTPYLWLIVRSWAPLPVNFDGPLETLREIWFFISRAGYAEIDQSASADWLDRLKFFAFFGEQLLMQFAVVGTALAAAGFALQWRRLGNRTGAALALAFLMPSVLLLFLLGFDYNSITRHIFHVYPLPAYAIGALCMAIGFACLVERYALRPRIAAAGGAAVLALIFAVGVRTNVLADHEWGARYAQTILRELPQNAAVIARGDPDLAPMAYFHMIENVRPDITLYQANGLILGNRLFHPLRTTEEGAQRAIREMIEARTEPVTYTLETPPKGFAYRDRWLYTEIDKSAASPGRVTIEIPEVMRRFFEDDVAPVGHANAWVAFFRSELRYRYASLLARSLPRDRPPDERARRHLELLANDYYGAIGIAEGLLLSEGGYSVGAVGGFLEKAREQMPSGVTKEHLSRYFVLRGAVRANMRDLDGAIGDFEAALSIWPSPHNTGIKPLEDVHREKGDDRALKALEVRVARLKQRRR